MRRDRGLKLYAIDSACRPHAAACAVRAVIVASAPPQPRKGNLRGSGCDGGALRTDRTAYFEGSPVPPSGDGIVAQGQFRRGSLDVACGQVGRVERDGVEFVGRRAGARIVRLVGVGSVVVKPGKGNLRSSGCRRGCIARPAGCPCTTRMASHSLPLLPPPLMVSVAESHLMLVAERRGLDVVKVTDCRACRAGARVVHPVGIGSDRLQPGKGNPRSSGCDGGALRALLSALVPPIPIPVRDIQIRGVERYVVCGQGQRLRPRPPRGKTRNVERTARAASAPSRNLNFAPPPRILDSCFRDYASVKSSVQYKA